MNIDEQHLQYASAGFLRGLRTLLASNDEIIHKTVAIIGNPSNVDADRSSNCTHQHGGILK
jgi:hypothetical protein